MCPQGGWLLPTPLPWSAQIPVCSPAPGDQINEAFLEHRRVLDTPGLALIAQEGRGWSGVMQCRQKGCSSHPSSLPPSVPEGVRTSLGRPFSRGQSRVKTRGGGGGRTLQRVSRALGKPDLPPAWAGPGVAPGRDHREPGGGTTAMQQAGGAAGRAGDAAGRPGVRARGPGAQHHPG